MPVPLCQSCVHPCPPPAADPIVPSTVVSAGASCPAATDIKVCGEPLPPTAPIPAAPPPPPTTADPVAAAGRKLAPPAPPLFDPSHGPDTPPPLPPASNAPTVNDANALVDPATPPPAV